MPSPHWKIRRELDRLWMQIRAPADLSASWLTRRLYDRSKTGQIALSEGRAPLGPDVAVYVVYRPAGLLASHLETVRFLAKNGFSPFVVVHHPLSGADMARLQEAAWRVMIRPNVGYDFGGYRDGVLHLLEQGISPNNLLLLNDSVWFPLRGDSGLLEELRARPEDLRGYVMDRHKRSGRPPFLQSFFVMFGQRVIRDPAFRAWWGPMLMTANKWLVIRRLEMGMTPFFVNRGFTAGAVHEYPKAGLMLSALPRKRLLRFFEIEWPRLGAASRALCERVKSGGAASPEELQQAAEESQIDGHILKLPPALLFDVFDAPMLKKLKNGHFQQQRKALIAEGRHEAFTPDVRDEILLWDR